MLSIFYIVKFFFLIIDKFTHIPHYIQKIKYL